VNEITELSTRQKLEKFHETAQELKSTALMKKGLSSSMTIRVRDLVMSVDTEKWPDEEELRSFLLTFRHFIADKEDVFMDRIFNLCQQKLTDDKLRGYLAKSRVFWKREHETVGFDLVCQGKRQTPEQVTKLWLSGAYFHKDEEKRVVLKALPFPLRMLFKQQFLSFLVGATHVIFYVDEIIKKVLDDGLFTD
jgi:hypothetical protein